MKAWIDKDGKMHPYIYSIDEEQFEIQNDTLFEDSLDEEAYCIYEYGW